MARVVRTCFITDLPSDVILDILSKWLRIRSVSRFDSALCSRDARSTLLEIFASNPFATKESVNIRRIESMKWLCLRKIRLVNIELDFYFPGLSEYLRFSAQTIRKIECSDHQNIDTIAIYCRELTSLNVNNTPAVENLNALLHLNPNLQTLCIEYLDGFESDFYIQQQNLSQLKSLGLQSSSFDDAKLINLIEGASSLQQLDLSLCDDLTDTGGMAVLNNCPQLRCLKASSMQLSDVVLVKLGLSCPHIMHLNLEGNSTLTDASVLSIAKNLKFLRSLNMSDCTAATDESVHYLAQYSAPTLRILCLVGMAQMRVSVLQELLQKCTQLVELSVECDISKYAAEIVPHMGNLQQFVTYVLISDDTLCLIATHCTQMKRLSIMSAYTSSEGDVTNVPVMYGIDKKAEWRDRLYTSKGFIALMNGLTHLELLGVRKEELTDIGLLNEFAQTMWRRLRPKLVFTDDEFDFEHDFSDYSIA